jgi:TonB-linked SusC/RagA family outer membrane protein
VRHVRKISSVLALLALCATSASAQQRRITGRVTGQGNGEPLASAAVSVVGTTTGTYTNELGEYSLLAPSGPVTLRVRRIGYRQGQVAVGPTQTEANVALERDVLQLETQVVTGTATQVSSANAANDVAVVSGEKLNQVPAQTIDQALQGKVSGAVISTNSGAPGGGTQVQIRGTSTILGNFSPLYVVDGVIVSNSSIQNGLNSITSAASGASANYSSSQDQNVNRIADLNPNDIESIQVLKGPSASSIYGSKGANGVIVITTKQGRAGKPTVDFTQRLGANYLSNKLDLRCFKSGAEYADYTGDPADAAFFDANNTGCHDYFDEFYGNNPLSYQSIASVRGGTSTGTTYYASGLVQHDGGLAMNDFYNKQSLRLNLGQTIGSRLNIRASSELLHTLTQRGISGNDNTNINPLTIFSQTPSFVDLNKRNPDGTWVQNPFLAGQNPFQDADLIKTPDNVYRLIGSATGTLSLLTMERQTLDFVMTGGVDAFNDASRVYAPANTYIEQQNADNAGTVFNSNANVLFANLTGTLTHRFTTAPFTATTSGGFRQERRETDITQVTARGFPFTGIVAIDQALAVYPREVIPPIVKDLSFFAQEEFLTLDERLLLTAGINAERSSNNGDQKKFYAYPKFSASYRVPYLPSWSNDLKLRAAYGLAGNFPTAGRFTFATTTLDQGLSGARLSTFKGAENIKPETVAEIEGGFDLTLFTGRAALKATQFQKKSTDLLLLRALGTSLGFSQQYINGGELVTNGTEVELNLVPIQNLRGLGWTSNTTFSRAKSKVTQLPPDVSPFNPGVGSFGSTFGNVFIQAGYSPNIIQAYTSCKIPLPSSGVCGTANKQLGFVGDATPDFQMGFSNDFTFGPLRLATLVDWRKGGYVINLTNNYFDGGLLADTAAGNERLRRLNAGEPAYVEKAGFVKLREVTLGYTLPARFTQSIGGGTMHDTRLELSGRNLVTWTKYTGLDPEVSNFSNQALGRIQDVTPYPPYRSFFFTISTSF